MKARQSLRAQQLFLDRIEGRAILAKVRQEKQDRKYDQVVVGLGAKFANCTGILVSEIDSNAECIETLPRFEHRPYVVLDDLEKGISILVERGGISLLLFKKDYYV